MIKYGKFVINEEVPVFSLFKIDILRFLRKGLSRFFLLSALLLSSCTDAPHPPVAVKGKLDLSRWNFDKNGSVQLNGEWEFYWQRLLIPTDFDQPTPPEMNGFFSPPSAWDGQIISGKTLGAHGYATFRLLVKIPPNLNRLTLDLWDASGAYQIWVNRQTMFEDVQVGTDRASTIPLWGQKEKTFHLSFDTVIITLQKANFYGYSGAFGNLKAGNADQIQRERSIMSAMELFCLSSLVVMGIYHFFFFLFRKKDRSSLYFSLVCLLWALYTPFAGYGGFIIWDIFPKPPLWLGSASGLAPWYLGVPVTLIFLYSLYPRQGNIAIVRLFMIFGIMFTVAVLILPDTLVDRTPLLYEWVSLCVGGYCLFMVTRAIKNRENGAQIILSGIALLMAFVVNDILMEHWIIKSIPLLPAGIVLLILSHALVLAKRFSLAHSLAESSAGELEKKNKELARMDKIKDEFLANTSHELRTPIHGIIGMTEALRSEAGQKFSDQVSGDLELIVSSARRLSALIDDILDFSRLSHADIKLKKDAVDMRILAKNVLRVSQTLVGKRPVCLINDISIETPFVWGDEARLQQILYNLVGNSIKFTQKGEVRLSACLEKKWVEFTVRDTGIGISQQNLNRIFNAFEQVDGSITRQFGGTGLGLAITRHLVELHDGTLHVESTPGKGTSFSFTIPKAPSDVPLSLSGVDNTAFGNQEKTSLPVLPPFGNHTAIVNEPCQKRMHQQRHGDAEIRILAIDDDPVNLRAVSRYLVSQGISVFIADSGKQGLEIIENNPMPDLVLLDIMMPQMSGYDVLRILRQNHPFQELPVIILTARNPVTDLVSGFETGANDYLVKPFVFEELMSRIRFQMDIRRAWQTERENSDLKIFLADQRQKKVEARLQAQQTALEMLRFQLNPHFLFNALTSIRGAVLRYPKIARDMVTALSEFCRLSLSYGMESTVSLDQEVTLVRHYLDIEQIRQGDQMQVSMAFDDKTVSQLVPAFLLQPLVENAVKYGRMTSPDNLEIRLRSSFQKNFLIITVANTGAWVEPESNNSEQGSGTGLDNIRKRLDAIYAGQFEFFHSEEGGWVVLELWLPRS